MFEIRILILTELEFIIMICFVWEKNRM